MFIAWRKFKYRFRTQKRKYKPKNQRSKRLILLGIVVVLSVSLSFYGFYKIESRIGNLAQQAAISTLNGEITKTVNRMVQEVIAEENIDLQSLIAVDKDENGTAASMSTNYNAINQIKSSLAIKVQEKMDNLDVIESRVPVGMLFSDTLMTGAGIKIPIKVFATNEIIVQFYDEFSDAGINQTRCRLWIEIKIPARVAGLFSYQDTEVLTQIPIAEKIIMGDVPQIYMDRN